MEKTNKRLWLLQCVKDVLETRLWLAEWADVPEAKFSPWFEANEETLVEQLAELRRALNACR